MLPIPTKIRAVREDPAAPLVECYPETPDALAAIFAARSTPTTPTTPKEKPVQNMTGFNEHASVKGVEKTHISGINASSDPGRLVDVLERLELISPEFAKPLKTICAHSDGKQLRDVLQVNVYKLDKALKATDATIEMRLAFKASLDRFGLLTVPR